MRMQLHISGYWNEPLPLFYHNPFYRLEKLLDKWLSNRPCFLTFGLLSAAYFCFCFSLLIVGLVVNFTLLVWTTVSVICFRLTLNWICMIIRQRCIKIENRYGLTSAFCAGCDGCYNLCLAIPLPFLLHLHIVPLALDDSNYKISPLHQIPFLLPKLSHISQYFKWMVNKSYNNDIRTDDGESKSRGRNQVFDNINTNINRVASSDSNNHNVNDVAIDIDYNYNYSGYNYNYSLDPQCKQQLRQSYKMLLQCAINIEMALFYDINDKEYLENLTQNIVAHSEKESKLELESRSSCCMYMKNCAINMDPFSRVKNKNTKLVLWVWYCFVWIDIICSIALLVCHGMAVYVFCVILVKSWIAFAVVGPLFLLPMVLVTLYFTIKHWRCFNDIKIAFGIIDVSLLEKISSTIPSDVKRLQGTGLKLKPFGLMDYMEMMSMNKELIEMKHDEQGMIWIKDTFYNSKLEKKLQNMIIDQVFYANSKWLKSTCDKNGYYKLPDDILNLIIEYTYEKNDNKRILKQIIEQTPHYNKIYPVHEVYNKKDKGNKKRRKKKRRKKKGKGHSGNDAHARDKNSNALKLKHSDNGDFRHKRSHKHKQYSKTSKTSTKSKKLKISTIIMSKHNNNNIDIKSIRKAKKERKQRQIKRRSSF